VKALSATPHARTLVQLLAYGRVAFALLESGTLPAVEFVRAGGDLAQLACVTALQLPLQALLATAVARRLSSAASSATPNSNGAGGGSSSAGAGGGHHSPLRVWRQAHTALLGLALLTPWAAAGVAPLVAPGRSDASRWLGTVRF
jgi:hypothetical protein